jgi:DNA-binding NarL/FixJ family response regulator
VPKPLKVFIVEDDQLLASALSMLVETLGYSVNGVADSAAAAVNGVLKLHPEIIIMDVNLEAARSGLDAARAIRLHGDVPIIFYTSYDDWGFRDQAAALHHTQIVLKPASDHAISEALMIASASAGLGDRTPVVSAGSL